MRIIEKASSSFESAQVIVARKAQSCNNSTIQCLPSFFIFLSFGRNVFLVVQEFPYSTLSFVLSAFLVDNLQILPLASVDYMNLLLSFFVVSFERNRRASSILLLLVPSWSSIPAEHLFAMMIA